jgi:alkylation response protein AidB-like acyl-CoA dehydrogenase
MNDTESVGISQFKEQARAWVEANLERRSATTNAHTPTVDTVESVAVQRAVQRRLYEAGYAGITFPVEYGGRGLTQEHEDAFDEIAAGYETPSFANADGVYGPCTQSMLAHASPKFLQTHIPRILRGEAVWVQLYSEPDAGSDLAGVRTRATRNSEGWLLNGAKVWTSGAHFADYGMCLARTNWDVPKHRGLTWFAVPMNAPGLTVKPIRELHGHSAFSEEFFDNVQLSDDDVIGEVDDGWSVTRTMLVYERGDSDVLPAVGELAPDLVALARGAGTEKDALVRQLIARAHINDKALSELATRVQERIRASHGTDAGVAGYIKLAAGTIFPLRSQTALKIAGLNGLLWNESDRTNATAESYLYSRMWAIAGGTNEVIRNGIGERVLGLPREPSFDSVLPFNEVIRQSQHWTGKVG